MHDPARRESAMQFLLIISHDESFRPTDALVADIGRWIR